MIATRFRPDVSAAEIRALAPSARAVEDEVRAIVDSVRGGGDATLRELTLRFDRVELGPDPLRVSLEALDRSLDSLDAAMREGLEVAIANVGATARSQLVEGTSISLAAGQRVDFREAPVRRAAAYVPGGRAPYPSTVVMCAATASAAGVEQLAICSTPAANGIPHSLVLAACRLCGVDEVYRVGGAQAIAALAYGTTEIQPVDVIVGPGNRYVQEAKRQVIGSVGIDAIAGPSELVIVAGEGVAVEPLVLDLLAQAEHGEDGLVVLITADPGLGDEVEARVLQLAPERSSVCDAPLGIVVVGDVGSAVSLADALAPEHLELIGPEAVALAGQIRSAGCVFLDTGTAFGDYVAGSNHVLPTGGAGRFQDALSVATFRRRIAHVTIPDPAAAALAPAGAALARAEGFPVHAESMEIRASTRVPDGGRS